MYSMLLYFIFCEISQYFTCIWPLFYINHQVLTIAYLRISLGASFYLYNIVARYFLTNSRKSRHREHQLLKILKYFFCVHSRLAGSIEKNAWIFYKVNIHQPNFQFSNSSRKLNNPSLLTLHKQTNKQTLSIIIQILLTKRTKKT